MRALTLTQPWAGLVASGIKLVENRPRHAPKNMIGQRFAIHAGRQLADLETWRRVIEIAPEVAIDYPGPMAPGARIRRLTEFTGAVIAVATLECEVFDKSGLLGSDIARQLGEQARWFFGPIGYVLRDVVALAMPIPCKGMLGFWTLPDAIEKRVMLSRAA